MVAPEIAEEMRADTVMYDTTCSINVLSALSEQGLGQLVLHECDISYCDYSGYNDNDGITTRYGKGQCTLHENIQGAATARPSLNDNEAFPL